MLMLEPGERLMIYRTRAGLSKKELAMRVGVSVTTISNYEKGKVEFDFYTLVAIANALGVTANEIALGFKNPEQKEKIEGLIKNSGIHD